MIKNFDEFCNTILKEEYHFSEPDRCEDFYGTVNIMNYIFNELVKKYYNIDFSKIKEQSQEYKEFWKKYPELEDVMHFLEDNEDDFVVGVKGVWENSPSINVIDDYSISEMDESDFEKCIKTIKTYSDKNMVDKMIDVIENEIDSNIIDVEDVSIQEEDDYDEDDYNYWKYGIER